MDCLVIRGGVPLRGHIAISGSKNGALPAMSAALLTDQPVILDNVPAGLADIGAMAGLLRHHGVRIGQDNSRMTLVAERIRDCTAPYDIVRKMRASILVLGPLLARFGRASVSMPGGCAIGARPVDFHVSGLRRLGADISVEKGYIRASAPSGLSGAVVRFPHPSVGATLNLLLAASLARGETVLENAAREPEIRFMAALLAGMGADIDGAGTDRLVIRGRPRLGGVTISVIPDRIEAGTYAVAAAMTGGDICLGGFPGRNLGALLEVLSRAGASVSEEEGGARVRAGPGPPRPVDVITEPYPGFPTDLQAQVMALATIAGGASLITETIFENRFMHAPELRRMGAEITIHNASAMVRGVPFLSGAPVMATDLRASVSLVLAGLVARGETRINRVYHLDRGYEALVEKLLACGADIRRLSG